MDYIPITDKQKRYLLSLWHWEFWDWSDDTKALHAKIKEGTISKYDASFLLDLCKAYDDQRVWISAHESEIYGEEERRAKNQLQALRDKILFEATSMLKKYEVIATKEFLREQRNNKKQ